MADGLARQIAGLMGDIRNLGKRIPSYQRGVVANVSPPTVVMDRDVTATPRPVADVLVPGLAVGQRVEVRVIGSRRVITSIHPADADTDTGWVAVATPSGWTTNRDIAYRVVSNVVYIRGRLTPTTAKTGTTTVLPAGSFPAPGSVFDSMRAVPSNHSSSNPSAVIKSAAVNGDGSVTVWYGQTNSDQINFAGLSGYMIN